MRPQSPHRPRRPVSRPAHPHTKRQCLLWQHHRTEQPASVCGHYHRHCLHRTHVCCSITHTFTRPAPSPCPHLPVSLRPEVGDAREGPDGCTGSDGPMHQVGVLHAHPCGQHATVGAPKRNHRATACVAASAWRGGQSERAWKGVGGVLVKCVRCVWVRVYV